MISNMGAFVTKLTQSPSQLLLRLLLCYVVIRVVKLIMQRTAFNKKVLAVPTADEPHWLWGHLPLLLKNQKQNQSDRSEFLASLHRYAHKTNAPLTRIHIFGPLVPWNHVILLACKPEVAQEILSNRNYRRMHKGRAYRVSKPLIGDGLLSAEEDNWKNQRKIAEPGFRYAYLRDQVVPTVQSLSDKLVAIWKKMDPNEPFDMYAVMLRFTADAIGLMAFAYDLKGLDAVHSNDATMYDIFRVVLSTLSDRSSSVMERLFLQHLPTTSNRLFEEKISQLRSVIQDMITQRLNKIKLGTVTDWEANDLLSQLLKHGTDGSPALSEQQVLENVQTFLFAGHDTTASALTWSLYILATQPTIEHKLYDEVVGVLDDKDVPTFDDIDSRMPYLNAFLKEILRLYPSAGFTRQATEDVMLESCGTLLPKDVEILFLPAIIHTDPTYWEDALTFKPERWLGDNLEKINQSAYFPFSTGPRNCVGLRLAQTEIRVLLCTLVRNFHFRHSHSERPRVNIEMTTFPINMHMTIQSKTADNELAY